MEGIRQKEEQVIWQMWTPEAIKEMLTQTFCSTKYSCYFPIYFLLLKLGIHVYKQNGSQLCVLPLRDCNFENENNSDKANVMHISSHRI